MPQHRYAVPQPCAISTGSDGQGRWTNGSTPEVAVLLVRPSEARDRSQGLSDHQWQRLARATIEFDARSDGQLHEELNAALRRRRNQAGGGLSERSGGLLLGYLVSEVMRRAANPRIARWDIAEFRECLLMNDSELITAVGRQDFGIVFGHLPPVPEVE